MCPLAQVSAAFWFLAVCFALGVRPGPGRAHSGARHFPVQCIPHELGAERSQATLTSPASLHPQCFNVVRSR